MSAHGPCRAATPVPTFRSLPASACAPRTMSVSRPSGPTSRGSRSTPRISSAAARPRPCWNRCAIAMRSACTASACRSVRRTGWTRITLPASPPWSGASSPRPISDHVSWSVTGGVYFNDLLPIPYDEEALAVIARNVMRFQETVRPAGDGGESLDLSAPRPIRPRGAAIPRRALPTQRLRPAARRQQRVRLDARITATMRAPIWPRSRICRSARSTSPATICARSATALSASTITARRSRIRCGRSMIRRWP